MSRSISGAPKTFMVLLLALLACALALPQLASAALSRKGAVEKTDPWNPHMDAEADIILPMPAKDLSLVMRLVAVPASGFLSSKSVALGVEGAESDRNIFDGGYETPLSAPFTAADLPEAWLETVLAEKRDAYHYYLIAKYEITQRQYKAVMAPDSLAEELTADDARPVTGISWHDAVAFTERYTTWLLLNHPDALPSFSGDKENTGFLRLPTEAEWEYAALGGQNNPGIETHQTVFPMEDGLSLADYAVYRSESATQSADGLAKIGSRKANPLGLYDVCGNAAEMTLDVFRFSMGGSPAGSAGGFVRKGGSCFSSEEEILPGRREELAPFLADGIQKSSDLGFRPVLSGINTPGGGRMEAVGREYETMERQAQSTADKRLMEELNALMEQTKDKEVRKNLNALRTEIEKSRELQERERVQAISSRLQNCVMNIKAMTSYMFRNYAMDIMIASKSNEMKKTGPEEREKLSSDIEHFQKSMRQNKDGEIFVLNVCQGSLSDLLDADPKDVGKAFQSLEKRYAGKDGYSRQMADITQLVRTAYNKAVKRGRLESSDLDSASVEALVKKWKLYL